jgi:NAD(P)-dependent dehydrogenase (short-subunit alcohol dehydrogenase family)
MIPREYDASIVYSGNSGSSDTHSSDLFSTCLNSYLKGLRVAVTGANRGKTEHREHRVVWIAASTKRSSQHRVIHSTGIGLDLATELTAQGAKVVAIVRSSSKELDALNPAEIIKGRISKRVFLFGLIALSKTSQGNFIL